MRDANTSQADWQYGHYQLAPPLSEEDRRRLRDSIAEHGVLIPVSLDQDGRLLDGHHRREWTDRYERVEVKNRTYTNVSVAVPIPVVMDAIRDAMVVSWTEGVAA